MLNQPQQSAHDIDPKSLPQTFFVQSSFIWVWVKIRYPKIMDGEY